MNHFIAIQGGINKEKQKELPLCLKFGTSYTVVGDTGSGKSQLIEDIASLSQGDSITQRVINIGGQLAAQKAIAHLSQQMTFVADYAVKEFFMMRFAYQGKDSHTYKEVIQIANQLTGEGIMPYDILTKLSGGQTRALMIADIILNREASIILIDEIENAGIDKYKAVEMLQAENKLVLMITHNPSLALLGEYRIVMRLGGVSKLVERSKKELIVLRKLQAMEYTLEQLKNEIRKGSEIDEGLLEQYMLDFKI
jgi:ABC-type lipoprotein export system ATPase subunit